MKYLIKFWEELVVSGDKDISDIPDIIKSDVITSLIASGHISENDIESIRQTKIDEMSNSCNQVIVSGIDIELSDGEVHHFSLEIPDQLKISKLNDRAKAGITELPYHADGETCKFYKAEDVIAINTEMENIIEFHVTYFNSLRDYINSMTDITDIQSVKYGTEIPSEFQSEVLKSLYAQMPA